MHHTDAKQTRSKARNNGLYAIRLRYITPLLVLRKRNALSRTNAGLQRAQIRKKFGLNRALRRCEAQMRFQIALFCPKISTDAHACYQRTSRLRFICPYWAQFRGKAIKEHKKFWCNVVPTSRHSCIRHSRQNPSKRYYRIVTPSRYFAALHSAHTGSHCAAPKVASCPHEITFRFGCS